VRDYADVKGTGFITEDIAQRALAMLDVDPQGFDVMDRKFLEALIERFDGGPVGLDNIAASIGEEPGTIEDVIEPYLIQQGYLQRTPRGRLATSAAWRHMGLTPPALPLVPMSSSAPTPVATTTTSTASSTPQNPPVSATVSSTQVESSQNAQTQSTV
jgi:hypothetical protein